MQVNKKFCLFSCLHINKCWANRLFLSFSPKKMWCEMGPAEPHLPTAFILEISRKDQPPLDTCRDGTKGVPLQQAKFQIQGSPQSSALSLTSPTRANRMDLLKSGSPKSKALDNLKAKIQRQRLEMMTSSPLVEIKCQDHITRKVCRVSSKGL